MPFDNKIFVLPIFEWPFYTGLTVVLKNCVYHVQLTDSPTSKKQNYLSACTDAQPEPQAGLKLRCNPTIKIGFLSTYNMGLDMRKPNFVTCICGLISAFVISYLESIVVNLTPCKISIFQLVSVSE